LCQGGSKRYFSCNIQVGDGLLCVKQGSGLPSGLKTIQGIEEWHLLGCYSVHRLLVTTSVVPSSLILVTLMKEALNSSESSDHTRATRRNIPEDAILHSHRRENLKSYNSRDCLPHRKEPFCYLLPINFFEFLGLG
jgi:hypothetical protein